MARLAALALLGACGFHISGGSAAQDAAGTDDAVDADVVDELVADEIPPIDGNHADWWDPAWTHRRRITLDATSLTGPVTNFPVLVRLPALTGTLANGADLRFRSIDNTTGYAYEIDSFNAAGTSPVWVRMTLTNAADRELWVYYGNATAVAESSGAAVFSTNHLSVHHLGSLFDATGNGHTASNSNLNATPMTNIAGRIGAARTFDGNDDYLVLANSNGPYDFSNEMYASAWIRVTGFEDQYQAIITKGDSSWRMQRSSNSDGVSYGWTNSGNNDNVLGDAPVMNGAWHHVAVVQTQTTKYVYVDGIADAAAPDTEQIDNNEYSVRIGMNEESTSGGARFWHGDIDEVRISSLSRDPDWIFAEYKTTDAMFAMVGVEENY